MSPPTPLGPHDSDTVEYFRIQQRYSTVRTAIRTLGCAVAAYCFLEAVKALAGQSTSVAFSLILDALVELRFAVTLALAGAACAWAVVERALRHRKVEHMQGRLKQLETSLDPRRSSSGLTTKGQTNPRDRR
jgi:hypothetical protein